MSNHSAGHMAEKVAAEYLERQGFKVRELNWKTRWCEIDIVAEKDETIYFVEVKYRKNTSQGSGLDYITPIKLRQMRFAAEMWVSQNQWNGEYALSALEVNGDEYRITAHIEDI